MFRSLSSTPVKGTAIQLEHRGPGPVSCSDPRDAGQVDIIEQYYMRRVLKNGLRRGVPLWMLWGIYMSG